MSGLQRALTTCETPGMLLGSFEHIPCTKQMPDLSYLICHTQPTTHFKTIYIILNMSLPPTTTKTKQKHIKNPVNNHPFQFEYVQENIAMCQFIIHLYMYIFKLFETLT